MEVQPLIFLSLFSASDGFVTTELFRYEQQYGGIFKVK
jgi:hypothetical protein